MFITITANASQRTLVSLYLFIYGLRDHVTGEWRNLQNEELHDLYSSPNIIRMNKSRRMRLAGHVARIGESRGAYRVFGGET